MPTSDKAAPLGSNSVRTLEAINEFQSEHGVTPTYRDLVKLTGCKSTSTVEYHIKRLLQRDLIEAHRLASGSKGARCLVLTEKGRRALRMWARDE